MPKTHVVTQGECLSSIAAAHGFADWRRIYDAPENADLRKARPNPNVLHPGDKVIIPDPRVQKLTLETGRSYKIVVKRPRVRLKLRVFQDIGARTIKAKFKLSAERLKKPVEGEVQNGLIDVPVPADLDRAHLVVTAEEGDLIEKFDLALGHLDPTDAISGLQTRLQELGFDCGPVTGEMNELTTDALSMFQRRFKLADDGTLNAATKAKLEELEGV